MSTIQNLFQQAQLAEVAYANFWDSTLSQTITADAKVKAALITEGMSDSQATAFVTDWSVVDQYTATGMFGQTWTGTGFSVTKGVGVDLLLTNEGEAGR